MKPAHPIYMLAILIFIFMLLAVGIHIGFMSGYQRGRIDALHGIQNSQSGTNAVADITWKNTN